MRIVVAVDSFKGCLSSSEVNSAVGYALRKKYPNADVVEVPVSDGGEGWLDALQRSLGCQSVDVQVHDPLMRTIDAPLLLDGSRAFVESAKAIGLHLLGEGERNPLIANSYGLGELIAEAVVRGADEIIVGLGGSVTSDAGIGLLRAIGDSICRVTPEIRDRISENVRFTIATDVRSPLCGLQGAARMFAPQKGADADMVEVLERRDRLFSRLVAKNMGYDSSELPGAGAAGGLGYAFMQFLDAQCVSGADLLLDLVGFDCILDGASLVITGEGRADRQTLLGKLPFVIMRRAKQCSVPVALIAGRIDDRDVLSQAGFEKLLEITPRAMSPKIAMQPDIAIKLIDKCITFSV